MKLLSNLICLCLIAGLASCSNKTAEKKTEHSGYFGKLLSIKEAYHAEDSIVTAKAKTESKSVDDLVAAKSKLAKIEEDAKAEFNKEVAAMTLPIILPFVDSTGNNAYIIKDVKITSFEWNKAILEATVQLKVNSEKTMGGQNIQFSVPALLMDNTNQVIKEGTTDNWLILATTKEMKAGETQKVTGSFLINRANAAMNKVLFKSYEAYKKAKGWN